MLTTARRRITHRAKRVIQSIPGGRVAVHGVREVTKRYWQLRLRRACQRLSRTSNPVFVKVGANDGITGDPFAGLLDERWRGLLVEPVPYCFERLQKNFADSRFLLERVAIGPRDGTAPFYYVDPAAQEAFPALPAWYDQLGSFDRAHIVRQFEGALEPFIREIETPVVPLSALLAKHGLQRITLLHVDTEGYDLEVLRTVDLGALEPGIVFVEHKHLSPSDKLALGRLLRGAGYVVHDLGSDYFCERRRQRS